MSKMITVRNLKLPGKGGILSAAAMKALYVIQYGLWLAAPIGQAVLGAILVFRRLYREFPVFLLYNIFHVAQAVAGIAIRQYSYADYFYFYWICEGVDALLSLIVIREVFSSVFRQYGTLERLGLILFRWAVLVVVTVGILTAASAPGTDSSRLVAGLLVLQRTFGFVVCAVVFFLFLFCHYFRLTWRNVAFGIAFGMGLVCSIVAVSATLRSRLPNLDALYAFIPGIAYDITIAIWISYSLASDSAQAGSALSLQQTELRQWNDTLLRILER